MTKLQDILDPTMLLVMMAEKRINVQFHPTLPLRIYNYSNIAQFAGKWTTEERVCRGLIVDEDDNIVARGPSKFFNYGQPGAPEVAMDDRVVVTRKEDGSLGILWYYDGHYGVATRGSFQSDQAIKATSMLTDNDKAIIKMYRAKNRTHLREIVYPENRIVLDYSGREELIRIGDVNNHTGLIEDRYVSNIIYGVSFEKPTISLKEALELPIPDNEEGYVVDILNDEGKVKGHIKLKGENYIRLHGAIFGLSERKIWEVLGTGIENHDYHDRLDAFISELPDELQPWAKGVANKLLDEYYDLLDSIGLRYEAIESEFEDYLQNSPRGDVARKFMEYPDIKGPLFSLLDKNFMAVRLWVHKQIKPAHRLFRTESEDTN